MFRRVFPVTGRVFSEKDRWCSSLIMLAYLLTFPAAGYPEESYLDAISVESEKLGDAPSVNTEVTGRREPAAADGPVEQFEQELEARYKGTYLFYKQLPVKSQEEVFLEHQKGASVEDVRKTIMNRYLHSR